MKFIPSLLFVVLAGLQPARAEVQLQGTAAELTESLKALPRVASLQGTAEVRTNANRATIDLLVSTEDRSLDRALTENARIREQLVRALTSRGIAADQIKNSEFASSQRHALFSDKVKSYRIENHVIVTARNGEQLRLLARQLDAQPEAVVQSIEFDHSDEKALRRRAVEAALADANEQKAVYERALNVRLTARSFVEGTLPQDVRDSYAGLQSGLSPSYSARGTKALTPMVTSLEPAFAFGELVFNAGVTVQYSVEVKP